MNNETIQKNLSERERDRERQREKEKKERVKPMLALVLTGGYK